MLLLPLAEVRNRGDRLRSRLAATPGLQARLVEGASAIGGGSAPGVELPTWLVAVRKAGWTADSLEQRLRRLAPPVIARIQDDEVVLDLRTVLPDQDALLAALLEQLERAPSS
jgi:L-seryl-tRNA(Ser) seleniumtransferase